MSEARGDPRITVSRDLLRAELSALELRLGDRVSSEIAKKADLDYVRDLHHRVRGIEAAGPIGERVIAEFTALKAEFDDIRMYGSHEAKESLRLVGLLTEEVEKLKLWRSYLTGAVAVSLFLGAFALDVILRRYV